MAADLLALERAARAFGADWPLISEYLDCFKPASGKEMTAKRRLRLAREIWRLWEPGQFQFGREFYRVGREEFREALSTTINQVRPPLTGHNYLKKVLLGAAEQTSRRKERELREKEERLRSGVRGQGSGARGVEVLEIMEDLPGPPEDEAWRKEFARINRLLLRARDPETRSTLQAEMEMHLQKGKELRRAELAENLPKTDSRKPKTGG